jgi:CheY-like chemotaxis protein
MRGPPLDWTVDTAETGEEVLQMNTQNKYDIICMDEHLDEKGPLEVHLAVARTELA